MKATFNLPTELVEKLRNAAVHLLRYDQRITLSGIVEAAIKSHLDFRLRQIGRKDFPKRGIQVKLGRRIK
jgi:hypothetical protein